MPSLRRVFWNILTLLIVVGAIALISIFITRRLPGEIIANEIVLNIPADLPAGSYRLTAGVYDELRGTRLMLPDGADAIKLAAVDRP
jgi:hypothetical protein